MSTIRRPSRKLAARLDLHIEDSMLLHDEDWDFKDADTSYLLHGLHPYPAKFIPQIPRRAIERWTRPGDLVIDPFCGSGTTLLECGMLGRDSIGVDNNSVATLVAKAKITFYSKRSLDILEQVVQDMETNFQEGATKRRLKKRIELVVPDYPNRNKWFDDSAVRDLGWIKSNILELNNPVRLLAMAVFSSVIIYASKQDSDTRYAAIERPYVQGSAIRRWIQRMKSVITEARKTSECIIPSKHSVHTADSRNLQFIQDNSVKLLVTSPPYLNAYDYHKYHRHRLHWTEGDVEFARDLEIGKHDTFTRPKATPQPFFDDFRQCMSEWERVLQPGGRALVVIGDSIVNKKFVPVGDTLAKIGNECGLKLERRWIRNLSTTRKSFNQDARIKREHLLLFRK